MWTIDGDACQELHQGGVLRVARDEALITHTLILMASKDLSQRRACWMMSMYEDMRDTLGLAAA